MANELYDLELLATIGFEGEFKMDHYSRKIKADIFQFPTLFKLNMLLFKICLYGNLKDKNDVEFCLLNYTDTIYGNLEQKMF